MRVSQFGAPRGVPGWVAAHLVARLTGEANRWMVECLGVGPDDRFLDVGCGPGLAVAYAAAASNGLAVGVDASERMVRLARRRHRAAARPGAMVVHRADAEHLPFADARFTTAGSLNSIQFWPSPDRGLAELHRVLVPGGRVAVVVMARSDEPAGPRPPPSVEETADRMRRAGFSELEIASRTFGGVLHRAFLGMRAQERRAARLSTPRRTG